MHPDESLFQGRINDEARIDDAFYCACNEDGNEDGIKDDPIIDCSVTENMGDVCLDGEDIVFERYHECIMSLGHQPYTNVCAHAVVLFCEYFVCGNAMMQV